MPLKMWSYDLAREQCPTDEHLAKLATLSQDSGYDALGLYVEHRYEFDCASWAQGEGHLSKASAKKLQQDFPSLKIIPFINLLGHMEGFLYTEFGSQFAESRFEGMQACPLNSRFVKLCEQMVDEVCSDFQSEIIHIGGDETWQLGSCPQCKEFVEGQSGDGKAALYGQHFGPLAHRVIANGKRPAVWSDMVLEHPEALRALPKQTLIFDWQYFSGCQKSSKSLLDEGFEVVACPSIQTYNATWCHLESSEQNIREISGNAKSLGLHGVCITTWECGLFGSYDTLFPALRAAARIADDPAIAKGLLDAYLEEGEPYEDWARLMGIELAALAEPFAPTGHRSLLKSRLLLLGNPFMAWLHHREALSGPVGEHALGIADRALAMAPNEACKGIALFLRGAVEFVRLAEEAHMKYAEGKLQAAINKLAITRQIFDDLERVANKTQARIGGSIVDSQRCRLARRNIELVIQNIRLYGDGSLGYLPSFEHLTNPGFVPQDQAAWWLINKWVRD